MCSYQSPLRRRAREPSARLEESKVRKAIRVTAAEFDVGEVLARRLLSRFFRAGLSPDLPIGSISFRRTLELFLCGVSNDRIKCDHVEPVGIRRVSARFTRRYWGRSLTLASSADGAIACLSRTDPVPRTNLPGARGESQQIVTHIFATDLPSVLVADAQATPRVSTMLLGPLC